MSDHWERRKSVEVSTAIWGSPRTYLAWVKTLLDDHDAKCAENDEQRARILQLIGERDSARFAAEQKWALRREIEQLLGVADGPAGDEQLRSGVEALRTIVAERDRLAQQLAEAQGRIAKFKQHPPVVHVFNCDRWALTKQGRKRRAAKARREA